MKVAISIVSHGDGKEICNMLNNSNSSYFSDKYEIIIRENKNKKDKYLDSLEKKFPNIKLIYNKKKFGFGKNHNLNFSLISSSIRWFIVCNPDLLHLPNFLELDKYHNKYHLISPTVLNIDGSKSDFLRADINLINIFQRYFRFKEFRLLNNQSDMWVASIFTIFTVDLYLKLNGYDEIFFMYCEDYDICMRGRRFCSLEVLEKCFIYHKANRLSRRNIKLKIIHIRNLFIVIFRKIIKFY